MKWSSLVIIFVVISGSVQDELILRLAKSGFNENNPGEFFETFSQMSENCTEDSNTVLHFNVNTGQQKWSFVEFTSPMKNIETVPDTYANGTFIQSKISVVRDGKCQIDAKVYLRPESIF